MSELSQALLGDRLFVVELARAVMREIGVQADRPSDDRPTCPACGQRFGRTHGKQVYCTPRCRWRLRKQRERAKAKA